jgi:hypothetical protein
MTEQRMNEGSQIGADIAAGLRDRGVEQAEHAKARLADGAERAAEAVERTAEEFEGDTALSGAGRSIASLMRQFAGGLRERDVNEFAQELGALARRNPGMFLGGSVALGFGIARFFKADTSARSQYGNARAEGRQRSQSRPGDRRQESDAEESLDLSSNATGMNGPMSRDDSQYQRDATHSPGSGSYSDRGLGNGRDSDSTNGMGDDAAPEELRS